MKIMISMTANKTFVVHLFIRKVSSVSFLFISSGERSVERLIVIWVIRLSVFVHTVCSSSCSFACAFVCVSGLFSCFSVCLVLLAINRHKNVTNNQIILIKSCIKTLWLQCYTETFLLSPLIFFLNKDNEDKEDD